MTLELTSDLDLVREILTSHDVWEGVSEDNQDKGDFALTEDSRVDWILIRSSDGNPVGCFKIERRSLSEVEAHIAILPKGRGYLSFRAVVELIKAFRTRFDKRINKMTAQIPEINSACIRLAERAGFKVEGKNPASIMKDGKFIDQVRLGVIRQGGESCHQF